MICSQAGWLRETAVLDYPVAANTRRCAATGRPLQPGEPFYGVLLSEGGTIVRRDYAPDSWTGPPAGALGFWRGRVPPAEGARRTPVDDESLLACLERLASNPEPAQVRFRYVVALLLLRRKRLRFEESRLDAGTSRLVLRCVRSGKRYEVSDPRLTAEEMAAVQDEVSRILGWH